ncbi:MAG: quinolinate synthase NadA [Verrucomicrobia bacterium]|nr:quinolinate synthase NadA [Verrucomicrobiota bacterium]
MGRFVTGRDLRQSYLVTSLQQKFLDLKRDRNAVVLAHNYQPKEIQEVADYVGDSLGLSYEAQKAKGDCILFCGVHFMAETAKIVNPEKKVLMPDLGAGCSLADSCPAEELEAYRRKNPGLYVVSYVNCTAAVKAQSDVICTSGNAEKIVRKVPENREILFLPDRNLGDWVIQRTGRKMRLWDGDCYVHMEFTATSIDRIRKEHPEARVVAHPECTRAVRALADEVCSTEKMVGYCRNSPAQAFIVVTEEGMLHRLRREMPDKQFIAGPTDRCACGECRYMKMNTLPKAVGALESMSPELVLSREVIERAKAPIERMLDWSRN